MRTILKIAADGVALSPSMDACDEPNTPVPAALRARFEFGEELGTGAAGTVYRARTLVPLGDLPLGYDVAVKVLRSGRTEDAGARRQFAREAAIGRQLESEFVVRIHAAEVSDDLDQPSFVAMEYVAGRSLRTRLEQEAPVTGTLTRRIGADAARGLAALHALGVVHRDVKPENLLLTDKSQLKLMDLGLAHSIDRRHDGATSSSGGFHGSFAYAAPEVLRGREHGPEADLYALGIVLFEAVTGRHPFADVRGNADAMIHAHLETAPPRAAGFAPRISVLLDEIIDGLLAKDPAKRFGPADELAETLTLGERSPYWRRHERDEPRLASARRLRAMRRPARTPFFGRAAELRRLERAWREAREGRGSTVHVSGP
ncbi:MAG: serine/threonine protein kinase, partial [Planctomycetes bacterium]|nr:serine/threonine protein kinase [Planctomycetota bacterium]